MSSMMVSEYFGSETGVFWDVDDCPIPSDITPALIYANIKSALENIGYKGSLSIVAYSNEEQNNEAFDAADINLVKPGTSRAKVNMMFRDVYMWGITHRYVSTNLMVISKDISQDIDMVDALRHLYRKDNNILLAHPANTSGVLLYTASSIWLWSSLSTGGSPLDIQSQISTPSPTPCFLCKKRVIKEKKRQAAKKTRNRKHKTTQHKTTPQEHD